MAAHSPPKPPAAAAIVAAILARKRRALTAAEAIGDPWLVAEARREVGVWIREYARLTRAKAPRL